MRFLTWGAIAGLLVTYVVVRLVIGIPSGAISTIGFATFGAIEIVATVWLAVGPHRRSRLVLAHALNAVGALFLSYASLQSEALIPNLIGTPFFVLGMLLWVRELQAQSGTLSDQSRQA